LTLRRSTLPFRRSIIGGLKKKYELLVRENETLRNDSAAAAAESRGGSTAYTAADGGAGEGEPPADAVFRVTACKNERVDGFYKKTGTDSGTGEAVYTKVDKFDKCVIEFRCSWEDDDRKRWRVIKKDGAYR
jgi:hypothetical protein